MDENGIREWLSRNQPDWTLIAATGPANALDGGIVLRDFAPYVASINAAGVVAFQAAWRDGRLNATGLFCGDGTAVTQLHQSGESWQFFSHPAINDDGVLSVYAERPLAQQAVLLWRNHAWAAPAASGPALLSIGPLGPTMNAGSAVAFRATDVHGVGGVYVADANGTRLLAACGSYFAQFHGLPVINQSGNVLIRADLPDGTQGIYLIRQPSGNTASPAATASHIDLVADTLGVFSGLGLFPMMNDANCVIFAATRKSGGAAIYSRNADAENGALQTLVDSSAGFQSLRGALINQAGPVAFFATPPGGELGIYRFARTAQNAPARVLAVGDALLNSHVAGFALNPVSCNQAGQLALRVALADGQQLILRAGPLPE